MAARPLTPRGCGSSQTRQLGTALDPTNQLSCLSGLLGSVGTPPRPPKGLFTPVLAPLELSWPCQSHLVGVQDREDDEVLGFPVTERRNEDGFIPLVMDLSLCNGLLRAHPTLPSPVVAAGSLGCLTTRLWILSHFLARWERLWHLLQGTPPAQAENSPPQQ